ncbi:MAG: hypothetical protein VX519_08090, partial [Myxococcota bacterium]|nr:hypothetical protein [Myxococcota bacterium]
CPAPPHQAIFALQYLELMAQLGSFFKGQGILTISVAKGNVTTLRLAHFLRSDWEDPRYRT